MTRIRKRARLYRHFLAATRRMPDKPLALLQALWLGVLDADALNDVTFLAYEGQGQDGFAGEEFNFQGFWPWELAAVEAAFDGCRSVLVAGAGGGREVIALARLGFEVTAFDFCAELNVACRRHLTEAGLTAHILDAPPDRLPEGLGQFDAVLVGRGFYHHIPGRARRVAFLRACRERMAVDAPIVISDFFVRPVTSQRYQRIRSIANLVRRLRRCAESVELGDWMTDSLQHAFVQEEIAAEMTDAGFRLESFKDSPFGEGSSLAHAIGRARNDR
jgi:SAM-dependent methyltransferase